MSISPATAAYLAHSVLFCSALFWLACCVRPRLPLSPNSFPFRQRFAFACALVAVAVACQSQALASRQCNGGGCGFGNSIGYSYPVAGAVLLRRQSTVDRLLLLINPINAVGSSSGPPPLKRSPGKNLIATARWRRQSFVCESARAVRSDDDDDDDDDDERWS